MLSIPSAMSGLTSYESDTTVGVIRPDIENEGTLLTESNFNSIIFNRQHVVQKV